MSELIQKNDNRTTIRWKLLTGASVLAVTAYMSSAARAEDAASPQLWIELGGQLSQLDAGQEAFAPPIFDSRPSIFSPSQKFEKPPLYGIDEYGSISLQPTDTDWIFTASIRYGRALSNRHVRQQTNPDPIVKYYHSYGRTKYPNAAHFADTEARESEQHAIIDFQAGKEVGLGLFGGHTSSTINLGVRFAQFNSKSNVSLKSDPDWHFGYKYVSYPSYGLTHFKVMNGQPYHTNLAEFEAKRSFRGIGPSLQWKSSTPFAGNTEDGQLAVDWSVNAAMLFGKQRTRVHHQATSFYQPGAILYQPERYVVYQPTPVDINRTKTVTVPNVGGSIGLTWQLQNFKMSFGYKADFFFNAIDGGIDKRKNENRGFFGPYASISIGLGD